MHKRSNYVLTTEQKLLLDKITDDLMSYIEDKCDRYEILELYDNVTWQLDRGKRAVIMSYIGKQLTSYIDNET